MSVKCISLYLYIVSTCMSPYVGVNGEEQDVCAGSLKEPFLQPSSFGTDTSVSFLQGEKRQWEGSLMMLEAWRAVLVESV